MNLLEEYEMLKEIKNEIEKGEDFFMAYIVGEMPDEYWADLKIETENAGFDIVNSGPSGFVAEREIPAEKKGYQHTKQVLAVFQVGKKLYVLFFA